MYVYTNVCMYVCMHVCIYIYIDIDIDVVCLFMRHIRIIYIHTIMCILFCPSLPQLDPSAPGRNRSWLKSLSTSWAWWPSSCWR